MCESPGGQDGGTLAGRSLDSLAAGGEWGVIVAGWYSGYTREFWSRRALLCPPAVPCISCVTLDKLLNLSGP